MAHTATYSVKMPLQFLYPFGIAGRYLSSFNIHLAYVNVGVKNVRCVGVPKPTDETPFLWENFFEIIFSKLPFLIIFE